jgi:LAS superfamily LD-carboxypeptidase LdcB
MRVIEPRDLEKVKHQRKTSKTRRGTRPYLMVLLVGGILFGGFMYVQNKLIQPQNPTTATNALTDSGAKSDDTPKKLKQFAGDEFKKLYSSYAYPNTQPLHERPHITGNTEADKRIQEIAESRGYKLSSVPVANIVHTEEPDLGEDGLIQPNALISWQEMKAAALKDGVKLQMTSAYRSIEAQRDLFVRRMRNDGIYTESVAAGFVDDMVVGVLERAAPPGYSRHHTGYTIDLACDGIGLDAFTTTSCYSWLSKNNYENTKKFGWVPSYPDGASLQGPEPEPWEYIWVSTYSLYE